jgi:hypothetical protein
MAPIINNNTILEIGPRISMNLQQFPYKTSQKVQIATTIAQSTDRHKQQMEGSGY